MAQVGSRRVSLAYFGIVLFCIIKSSIAECRDMFGIFVLPQFPLSSLVPTKSHLFVPPEICAQFELATFHYATEVPTQYKQRSPQSSTVTSLILRVSYLQKPLTVAYGEQKQSSKHFQLLVCLKETIYLVLEAEYRNGQSEIVVNRRCICLSIEGK